MVEYVGPAVMNGILRMTLHAGADDAPLADASVQDGIVGFFEGVGTVGGTVDAEIITRIGHTNVLGDPGAGWGINDHLTVGAGIEFSATDFALNPGMDGFGAGLYVLSTDEFPEGYTPTPSEIVLRATELDRFPYTSEYPGVLTADVPFGFSVEVPAADLDQNTKYWALLIPVAFDTYIRTPEDEDEDPYMYSGFHHALTAYDTNGRALSFWTNRTPEAPTILSPVSGTVVTPGTDVEFSFQPNDPDGYDGAPNDYRPWSFADMSGMQVQYAPRPSPSNPDPEWIDLPIAHTRRGYEPTEGPGWYIEYANPNNRFYGAKQLHETRRMTIRCGGSSLKHGYGSLPSGNWQLRMRTFDYGHPMSTIRHTDTALPGWGPLGGKGPESPDFDSPLDEFAEEFAEGLTPDTMPADNVSPWSEPVNIAISEQVPAPIPLSPINHNAITEGSVVTLRWDYRNTHRPSLPQKYRQVQIRAHGEDTWTTLVSGNESDHFYTIGADDDGLIPYIPDPGPYSYLDDPDFEGGTTDGWETNTSAGPDAALVNVFGPLAHGGSGRALVRDFPDGEPTTGFYDYPIRQRIPIREGDRYFSVKGWFRRGDSDFGDRDNVGFNVWFLNAADNQILAIHPHGPNGEPVLEPEFDFTDIDEDGWAYYELLDLQAPVGTGNIWVFIDPYRGEGNYYNPGSFANYDAIDDMAILGSPTLPVEPDPLPAPPLPSLPSIPYVLEATTQYEWRVRVADTGHIASDWSAIGRFWVVPQPGSGPVIVPGATIEGATLGCGTHTVSIYRRGGKNRTGVLTQVGYVDWGRLRDDMSDAKVIVSGWDVDCGELLKKLQTWAYEVVIHRDNGFSKERVWEGPITLLTYENDKVTIHAKDVIAYLYRRIIKQLLDDSGNGDTVVARAARIVQNVMAPDDPNVLAYLQAIVNETDPMQYRNLPPWARTAYEEIDDMAANSGLDYTAVGRAILLWGTKSRIGLLPELRDEHLGSSPIVSEYGMSMSNVYSVSDGNGVHGEAYRLLLDEEDASSDEIYGPEGEDPVYGLVERLSSSWASETEEDAGTYTQEGLATVERSFSEFAERSIADSYPPPVVVRVPDNTTLNPNTPLSIQSLVPGVAIPLRSGGTLRVVRSMQKLDSVKVVETGGKETISIILSPFNHEVLTEEGPDV